MNVYDQARLLANLLKRSDEYERFCRARDNAFRTEQNKKLIRQYKAKQFKAQAAVMSGGRPDDLLVEDLRRLGNVLQLNSDVSEYLAAEYQVNQMMSEIFKILGEAVDINLDFLKNEEE